MEKILFVEDNNTLAFLTIKKLKSKLDFEIVRAKNFSETRSIIEKNNEKFFLSILDYNLPDAPDGEIIDYILGNNIPAIIFTGILDDDIRDRIWAKGVVDYVFKEGEKNLNYLVTQIERIYNNKNIKALVVEDSRIYMDFIVDLLQIHQYDVITAKDGFEALKKLDDNNDIKLVIIDQYMPKMDGIQLTSKIRDKFGREKMVIIGLSAQGHKLMSAKFIKNGANDFINKPFLREEFYCRITQNITLLEFIEKIENASNIDYLTGLYNRRFFFNSGNIMFANARRENKNIAVSMIDLDFFKKINDTYGHLVGDKVLKKLARILKERFRQSDIISRFGGEEFCILITSVNKEESFYIFDSLRKEIEKFVFEIFEHKLKITVSIGVCVELLDSLEKMINKADEKLYEAKNSGRNCVLSDG